MNLLEKTFKHFNVVNKHRLLVLKLSIKCGNTYRGVVHDLSKYSPIEFWESVKYFNGKESPIDVCIRNKGYSLVWLHHKACNKHHLEYWEYGLTPERKAILMPYKYIVELICDRLSAGMVYAGKNWSPDQPLKYWLTVDKKKAVEVHPATAEFIETVLGNVANNGLDSSLNKKYLKEVYFQISNKYSL